MDATEYQKQIVLIRKAADEWWFFVRDRARGNAMTFTDSRKLIRLYNALRQIENSSIICFRMMVDAWDDWKGAAMRDCRTSFDTWGDIEKSGNEGRGDCKALIALKNAIERKELYDDENNS